ncbi:hypothetical protein KY331_05620, partial [Candidatus Woesearchaeota archaeon]|nr:hypothetical protein [Candidatus Woesearchaeota archaeon]
MDPIQVLREFYEEEIAECISVTASGKRFRLQDSLSNSEETCISREHSLAKKHDMSHASIWKYRRKAISPFFFDALKKAEKELDGLEELVEKVDCPLVEDADKWVRQQGGVENISQEYFDYFMEKLKRPTKLSEFMDAITVLEIASQHPEKIDEIGPNFKLSGKAMYRLFYVPTIKRALQVEIAETVYPVIPDDAPKYALQSIEKIEKFVRKRSMATGKLHQGILGKYNLPSEIFLEWIDAKGLEKTLDKTYIPTSQRE